MKLLARLIEFYRVQAELIWNWRRGRRQLVWRAIVSFVVAFVALGVTAALLPGLRIDSPLALAGAVITIGALSALVRPVLLAMVAPFSMLLMCPSTGARCGRWAWAMSRPTACSARRSISRAAPK